MSLIGKAIASEQYGEGVKYKPFDIQELSASSFMNMNSLFMNKMRTMTSRGETGNKLELTESLRMSNLLASQPPPNYSQTPESRPERRVTYRD